MRAEEGSPVHMAAHSDGVKGPALTGLSRHRKNWEKELEPDAVKESYIHMDGQGVFKFAVRKVPEIIEEVLEETGNSLEEIDYFILHQANRRIIEAVAKRLKTDIAKFPMNLEEYANTSAATVPILIDEMNRKGMFEKGQKDHDGRIRCRDLPGRQACLSGKATNYGNSRQSRITIHSLRMAERYNPREGKYFQVRKEKEIMLEKIKEIVADSLNADVDTLTEETSFKDDLGADSLDLFEMVMAFEEEFDVEIPSEDLEQINTIGDVVKYLEAHK